MEAAQRGLLVEGWRWINHSYALLNQHQLLAMRGMKGLALYHRDLPFAYAHWNAEDHDAGFPMSDRTHLQALREPRPGKDRIDAVYRICSPIRGPGDDLWSDKRTLTFIITEIGLGRSAFAKQVADIGYFVAGENAIATSSEWSRARIVEYGFPPERVHVVPLGVDPTIFAPLDGALRAEMRAALALAPDEILFLNIGAPLWNKGTELLLRAFTVLRLRGMKVRLMLKDQSGLYGIAMGGAYSTFSSSTSAFGHGHVLDGVTTIPINLAPAQLGRLMACADCYVSPYRAEGFNLPVLESIACGVPTIVTAGGATDDFCDERTSLRVEGRFARREFEPGLKGAYIEPDMDALTDAMTAIVTGWRPEPTGFAAARDAILERHSWSRAAEETVRLAFGDSVQ